METGKSFRAVYRDSHNRTYSAPVVKLDGQWQMVTSEGSGPITAQFQDDIAGPLFFDHYREVESEQLHVEPGTNWSGHKQAFAEQEIAEQRKQRQAALQKIKNDSAARELNRIAAARDINAQFAARLKPRGSGTSQATDIPDATQITRGDIEAVIRNRR